MTDDLTLNDGIISDQELEALNSNIGSEGLFVKTLSKSPNNLRKDVIQQQAENLEFGYRTIITKLKIQLRNKMNEETGMIHQLIPSHTTSIKTDMDLDVTEFTEKSIELGLDIRDLKIRITNALATYKRVIGQDFKA